MLVFGDLAAGVGQRIEAHVERALAHRGELGVRLHQRRARIDLGDEGAVGALLDLLRELAAEAVAEIAFVDGAAGKLVRDLERGRGAGVPANPEGQDRGSGDRRLHQVTA